MKELIFATHNQNKAEELRAVLPAGYKLMTLTDINWEKEIVEDASTLEGNAKLKSEAVFTERGIAVFADDTGLEVNALDGKPGVHSARYAGEQRSNEANIDKLLAELLGSRDRTAQFRTVISFIDAAGSEHQFQGRVEGKIAAARSGERGFGYDPVFIPEGYSISFAQMDLNQKNSMSHRARAFAKFLTFLNDED